MGELFSKPQSCCQEHFSSLQTTIGTTVRCVRHKRLTCVVNGPTMMDRPLLCISMSGNRNFSRVRAHVRVCSSALRMLANKNDSVHCAMFGLGETRMQLVNLPILWLIPPSLSLLHFCEWSDYIGCIWKPEKREIEMCLGLTGSCVLIVRTAGSAARWIGALRRRKTPTPMQQKYVIMLHS